MPTMLFTSPATCSVYIINSHVRRHLLLHIWNAFDVRLISVTHLPFAKYVDTYCFHPSAWNVIVVTSFMSWPNTQYGRTCLHILSVYWNEIILWALLQNESINVNVATFVSFSMCVLCWVYATVVFVGAGDVTCSCTWTANSFQSNIQSNNSIWCRTFKLDGLCQLQSTRLQILSVTRHFYPNLGGLISGANLYSSCTCCVHMPCVKQHACYVWFYFLFF